MVGHVAAVQSGQITPTNVFSCSKNDIATTETWQVSIHIQVTSLQRYQVMSHSYYWIEFDRQMVITLVPVQEHDKDNVHSPSILSWTDEKDVNDRLDEIRNKVEQL